MVNATVGNTPVTEALDDGDSVTVPSGEVWVVTCSVFGTNLTRRGNFAKLEVDGTAFVGQTGENSSGGGTTSASTRAVFESGQSISFTATGDSPGQCGAYISGFVVDGP